MQPTFDMLEDQARRMKESMLDDIVTVIDFRRIEKLLLKMYRRGGRPPIPPIMLFKALLLVSGSARAKTFRIIGDSSGCGIDRYYKRETSEKGP